MLIIVYILCLISVMDPNVIRRQMLMQQFTMLKFFLSALSASKRASPKWSIFTSYYICHYEFLIFIVWVMIFKLNGVNCHIVFLLIDS